MAPKKRPYSKAVRATRDSARKPAIEIPDYNGNDSNGKFMNGNKLWQRRTKHGRDKKFTPDTLWSGFLEYLHMMDDNPIQSIDFRGKDATEVKLPLARAYTWQSLEVFLEVESLREYKTNYKDFSPVITRIGKIIHAQKFEGAAAGIFNANIIARDLGLREQTHMTLDDDRRVVGDVFPEALDHKKE